MYIKLFSALSILLFTFNCNAFSQSPYADGRVNVKIVNNTPCLYIDRSELIGAYFINISNISQGDTRNSHSIFYKTTFEENYPNKEKCIMLDSSNFPGIKLEDKQIYAIDLHPDPNKNEQLRIEPNFTGFGDTICLKKDQNGHFRVQDYIRGECVDRVPNQSEQKSLKENKGSWFDRFIEWLKSLLS
jgi:hypothetical protein